MKNVLAKPLAATSLGVLLLSAACSWSRFDDATDLPALLRDEPAMVQVLGRSAAVLAVPEPARPLTLAGLALPGRQLLDRAGQAAAALRLKIFLNHITLVHRYAQRVVGNIDALAVG